MTHPQVLSVNQLERIETILDELLAKTRSTYVLLADISGQLITVRGRIGTLDPVALSALIASNMAATAEMARRIGEPAGFQLLFHEGDQDNIYLSHVKQTFVLAVVFAATVQIGLVRLFSKRAVEELSIIAAEYESVVSKTPMMEGAVIDPAFEEELARLLPSS